jgi:hypothetical protein
LVADIPKMLKINNYHFFILRRFSLTLTVSILRKWKSGNIRLSGQAMLKKIASEKEIHQRPIVLSDYVSTPSPSDHGSNAKGSTKH